jgi:hypothetical protein
LKKWSILWNEIPKLDQQKDAYIDLVFDYTAAAPIPPQLHFVLFTKSIGMAMDFPGLIVWRIIPGNPKKNPFLVQIAKSIPDAWMGKMRVSSKRFRNWEEMNTHLDKYRETPTNQYCPPNKIKFGRLDRLFEYLDDRLHLEVVTGSLPLRSIVFTWEIETRHSPLGPCSSEINALTTI